MAEKKVSNSVNSHQLYLKLVNNYQKYAKYWGFDVYRDDFTIGWRFIVTCLWTTSAVVELLYFSYINLHDQEELYKSLIFMGCFVQQLAKMWNILANVDKVKECHQMVLDVTKNCQGQSEKTLFELNSWFFPFAKVLYAINLNAVTLLSIYPFFSYFQFGKKEFIFYFFLPFIDGNTSVGYGIQLFVEFLQSFNTSVFYAFTDAIFFYSLFFAGAYEELVENDCKLLTETIFESVKTVERPNAVIQAKFHTLLVNAIKRSQTMDEFFEKIKFFENLLMIQFGCLSYTLMITLVVMKYTQWYAIYSFGFVVIFEITVYSVIGTYIELKYDRLPSVVYDIPWYYLSISDQKMLVVFLHHTQKIKRLYILGESTLNVAAGLSILKFVYSAYVMLDQFY